MDPVDRDNLSLTGRHRAVTGQHLAVENDVTVIVTQAYGPRGDNLVGIAEGIIGSAWLGLAKSELQRRKARGVP